MNKLFFILILAVCAPMSLLAQSASKVGVNTREPSENLHVKGTVRVEKLPVDGESAIYTNSAGQNTTTANNKFSAKKMVVANEHGVLGTIPGVVNWFFMPSITINTATMGTPQTIDLYEKFREQFQTPKVKSANAPQSIMPTLPAKTDLYYYVTDYDTNVLTSVSISANGVMTYTVSRQPSEASYVNIVFVLK